LSAHSILHPSSAPASLERYSISAVVRGTQHPCSNFFAISNSGREHRLRGCMNRCVPATNSSTSPIFLSSRTPPDGSLDLTFKKLCKTSTDFGSGTANSLLNKPHPLLRRVWQWKSQ